MTILKRLVMFLLAFALFLSGGLSAVRTEQAEASDDVSSYSDEFQQVYVNNYDEICADYAAGYTYVAFIQDGFISSYKFAGNYTIVLSAEPLYVSDSYRSGAYILVDESGNSIVSNDSFHAYSSSGLGWYASSAYLYGYYASNYDFLWQSSGVVYRNARNLPDWFSVAYVDAAACASAIPKCTLVSNYYLNDGYVAYYYYKDYPEYAFCVASNRELYIVNAESDTDNAFKYIAPVVDGAIVSKLDTNDELYVYNRKLGTWAPYNNSNGGVFFQPNNFLTSLFATSHMLNSANDGDNFTLLGSNKAISQADFDSSGTLLTELEVSAGGVTGGSLSFPKAPVRELPELVQVITWSNLMTEVVGLVPLLVGLVISFLALRKGLSMLYQRLHKG